jgi:hypothetical protein
MHTEMAKTRDQLYLDRGISDTMIDYANDKHKLDDNPRFHKIRPTFTAPS